ncbi:MAG: hypothetical protein ABGY09_00705 [Euryarchaeota archaeon]
MRRIRTPPSSTSSRRAGPLTDDELAELLEEIETDLDADAALAGYILGLIDRKRERSRAPAS